MGLFAELKRRNVIRVALAYLVASWLLLQITDVLADVLDLPDVLGRVVFVLLALGFVLVVAFAWAFELTPDGIKREHEVDRSASLTHQTGKRLNTLIIVLLAVAAGYFFWESRFMERAGTGETATREQAVAAPAAAEPADDSASHTTQSIAVLPFANMSADPDNEFFADGLSEEILNRLAQVPELRVIARTSSFAFKGQNQDLREIGETLGAAHVLEGSVRRQGEQVRVTAQLIDTSDGAHLWSDTWDRELEDVFAIQDEVAENVVDALDIVLDEPTRRAMRTAGVRDVEAFVAYQRGSRMYIDAHGQPGLIEQLREANQWFDRAIEAEPGFADAYARKTDLYAHIVLDSEDISEAERQEALDTMLALWKTAYETARDPDRRRVIDIDRTFFSDDWSRLPGLLTETFASDSCADGNWMELALPFGMDEQLIEHYQRGIRCDPLMLLHRATVANLQMRLGDMEAARATLAAARSVGGEHRWVTAQQRLLQLASGEAEALLDGLEGPYPIGTGPELAPLGRAQTRAVMGRTDEARQVLASLPEDSLDVRWRLIMHAALGERDAANAEAAALDARAGGPVELVRTVNFCECGAPFDLDATPRLKARVESAGFPWPPEPLIRYPAKDW